MKTALYVSRLRITARHVALALAVCAAVFVAPHERALASDSCSVMSTSDTDAVFNQAFSTIRKLSDEAIKAKRRGAWKPNGSFAKPFFRQASKSLRRIRALLDTISITGGGCGESATATTCTATAVPKSDLMRAFDAIFSVDFPRGLEQLKRFKRSERRKFSVAIDALPQTLVSCS